MVSGSGSLVSFSWDGVRWVWALWEQHVNTPAALHWWLRTDSQGKAGASLTWLLGRLP